MTALVLDHLWQSTLFGAGAALLTLALRNNGAHIRFWVWFAASVKFLIPFSGLAALGSYLLTPIAPQISASHLLFMQPAAQPFSAPPVQAAANIDWTPFLVALWGLGFAAMAMRWLLRWSQLRRVARAAADFPLAAPVRVRMAPSSLEPGLVGIWRPFILLPQGIAGQLSAAELDAIMAHEICHLRRRDNLLTTIHMLVETLFWFHPLVWWLGARLNAERERACDEKVLASGTAPHIYAASILKVCKFCLQSPLASMAGVSGGNLGQRIRDIVSAPRVDDLHSAKKAVLGLAGALTLALPMAAGLLTAPLGEPARRQIAAVQMRASQELERSVAAILQIAVLPPDPSRSPLLAPKVKLAMVTPLIVEPPSFTIAPVPEESAVVAMVPAQPVTKAVSAEPTAPRVAVVDGEPDGRGEADHITCRAAQAVTGSRVRGPRICLTNREWAQMHEEGRVFAPDGLVVEAASKRCAGGNISVSGNKQYQGTYFVPVQVSSFVYCR